MRAVCDRLNGLLGEINQHKQKLNGILKQMQAEIDAVKSKYVADVRTLEATIDAIDKQIRDIIKSNKDELFVSTHRCELKNGAVLYQFQWRVKRARGVLKKLKELGYEEAIKVSESVRWDMLEKWPEEKLNMVGTLKILKESFEYEIYGG